MNLTVHSMQPRQHEAQQQQMEMQHPPGAASNAFSFFRIISKTNRIISMIATNNEPRAIEPKL
jgi:hypothetical protein